MMNLNPAKHSTELRATRRKIPIKFIFMPVKLIKLKSGKVRVETPTGVKSFATTPANAQRQRRLLKGVEHGWKPTHRNPEKMPLDDIIAQGPPLYKLHDIELADGGKLRADVPVAMYPNASLRQVDFKFWGLNSYDAHIAFPSLRGAHVSDFERAVKAVNYQIIVLGQDGGPSITAMYRHPFASGDVNLTFGGLVRHGRALISLHNALEHLPKLPNGWQYLQFVN